MNVMNKRIVLLGCASYLNRIQGLPKKGYEESRKDNDSMTTNGGALIQPQRSDRVFIDRSRDLQAVIALEIGDGRPGIDA